jgi:hypothetical protein
MIIIKLQGGLGNQMFQYAFASILAKKNNDCVLIDKSFFELIEKKPGFTPREFDLAVFKKTNNEATSPAIFLFYHLTFLDKIKKKMGFNYPKIYNEPFFGFYEKALDLKSPVYINGYFQSYKYFIGKERFIKKIFSFPIEELDLQNKNILSNIEKTNTISVHIRRGDYVNDRITQQFHGNCDLDYYLDAIAILASQHKTFTLLFFSDDSDWAKEQFEYLPYPKLFIDHNKNENSWKDMCLMSSCNHNIIANSSFSWWAAWLNENLDKTVIAPKNWFKTKDLNIISLLPEEWIKI